MLNDNVSGDLISREATLNLWCANCIVTKFGKACNRTCRDIERIKSVPAVDAAPVVHRIWIADESDVLFHCSECEAQIESSWDYEESWNYCPNCGAKMEEKHE